MAISITKSKASKLSGPSGRDAGGPQVDGLEESVDRLRVSDYTSGPTPNKQGNGGQSPNQFSGKPARGG